MLIYAAETIAYICSIKFLSFFVLITFINSACYAGGINSASLFSLLGLGDFRYNIRQAYRVFETVLFLLSANKNIAKLYFSW